MIGLKRRLLKANTARPKRSSLKPSAKSNKRSRPQPRDRRSAHLPILQTPILEDGMGGGLSLSLLSGTLSVIKREVR